MSKLNFESLKKIIDKNKVCGSVDKKYRNSSLLKELDITEEEFKKFGSVIKKMVDDEDVCKNSELCPLEGHTHVRLVRNDFGKISTITIPCEKFLKNKKSQDFIKNYFVKNFSDNELELRLSKKFFSIEMDQSATCIISKFIAMAKKPNEIKNGFYLFGDYGIGKTYASIAFANELTRSGKTVCFIFVPDVVYKLKQGFSQGSSINNNEIVEKMKNCDVLFLDDIGAEEASLWFYNEYLLVVLNYRMQRNMPTFFISNLSMNDLQRKMIQKKNDPTNVARLIERIKALTKNTELKMLGKNLRY